MTSSTEEEMAEGHHVVELRASDHRHRGDVVVSTVKRTKEQNMLLNATVTCCALPDF